MARIEEIARETPGVAHTVGISGQSLILNANAPNLGSMYVMLEDFDKRRRPELTADAIAGHSAKNAREPSATPLCPPSADRLSTVWAPPAASN